MDRKRQAAGRHPPGLQWLGLIVISAFLVITSAHCEPRRFALLMGNQDYTFAPVLRTPRADARALAGQLRLRNFDVTELYDLDKPGMDMALHNFEEKVTSGSVVFIYFAGHGVEISGISILAPVGLRPAPGDQVITPAQALREGVELPEIEGLLRLKNPAEKGGYNFLIIDACRDYPFVDRLTRSMSPPEALSFRGIVPHEAAGMDILYSAGAGQRALDNLGDGDQNPNGVFMRVLLQELDIPGLTLRQIGDELKIKVGNIARGVGRMQTPASYEEGVGSLILTPAPVNLNSKASVEQYPPSILPSGPPLTSTLGSLASTPAPNTLTDRTVGLPWHRTNGGCLYWNSAFTELAIIRWQGACDSENKITGFGTLSVDVGGGRQADDTGTFLSGREYDGHHLLVMNNGFRLDWMQKDGAAEGDVTAIYPGGGRYRGRWSNMRPNGQGTLTVGSVKRSGIWIDGCFGKGTSQYAALGRALDECR